MSHADLIKKLATLPREQQTEVFDFVEFLIRHRDEQHVSQSPRHTHWKNTEFSTLSMTQALRGMKDDPIAYGLEDLKERWL
ncbi:MAG: DUF2281 domain-containing protein [Magnetococcus sp. YQC-5]